jgi:hypothetical protein
VKKQYAQPYHEPPPSKFAPKTTGTTLSPKALSKVFAPLKREPSKAIVHKWDPDLWITATTGTSTGTTAYPYKAGSLTVTSGGGSVIPTSMWPTITSPFAGLGSILTSGTAVGTGGTLSGTWTSTGSVYLRWDPAAIPPEARRAMQEAIIDCSVLSLKRRYEA